MLEARGGADHRLIDLAAGGSLLLLAAGRGGFGLGILGTV